MKKLSRLEEIVIGILAAVVLLFAAVGIGFSRNEKQWKESIYNSAWQEGYEAGFDDGYYEGYQDGHYTGTHGMD